MAEKSVNIKLLDREHKAEAKYFRIMEDLINDHHPELKEAKIALAWNFSWRADPDDRLILGKCQKTSDLQKEFAEFDFIISLNEWHVNSRDFEVRQLRALIDHELMHAAPMIDKSTGKQKKDERGRLVWRIRKHNLEEFREIVERHGLYKADLEEFARACREHSSQPLLKAVNE